MLTNISFSLFTFQAPEGIPKPSDNEPIDFTELPNVIVFIVIPILVLIFYFLWKKGKSNRKK